MPTSDHDRRELFQTLEATLGRNAAGILMDHLPPSGWGDLATRHDVALAVESLKAEISESMNRQTWRLIGFMLAVHAATTGVTVALFNQLG